MDRRLRVVAHDVRNAGGEVREWLNRAVSKTVEPLTGFRGFESLPLRQCRFKALPEATKRLPGHRFENALGDVTFRGRSANSGHTRPGLDAETEPFGSHEEPQCHDGKLLPQTPQSNISHASHLGLP